MKPLLKLTLPLSVQISKKKKFILNMNQYRNLHFRSLSSAKNAYHKIVAGLLMGRASKIKQAPLLVRYDYYHGNKRRHDVMNQVSVLDKFTLDAIVSSGIIRDDNTDVIKAYYIVDRGVDKTNPRCEMRIYKFKELMK